MEAVGLFIGVIRPVSYIRFWRGHGFGRWWLRLVSESHHMHLAVPTSLPGRRHPLRAATLIRRRTTRRRRRTWTVALIISALALGSASIALAVVTVTLG